MRKFLSFFAMVIAVAVIALSSSCSTAKSVNSSFTKNGYTMTVLSPQQQVEVAPVLNAFPPFSHNAMGYIKTGDATTTFVYAVDATIWDSYCGALQAAGFMGTEKGYVKGDKSTGLAYKVSSKFTTIYKQTYLLVTYSYDTF